MLILKASIYAPIKARLCQETDFGGCAATSKWMTWIFLQPGCFTWNKTISGIWHQEVCSTSFKSWKIWGGGHHTCSQLLPQMLGWIQIWGAWRPSQHLRMVVLLKPFHVLAGPQPSGSMMVCYKAPVKATPTWRAGPKGSPAKHRPKHHTDSSGCPCILALMWSLGKTPTLTTIHVMEEKSRPASSSDPWSSVPRLPVKLKIHRPPPIYPTPISRYSFHTGLPDQCIQ